MASYANISADQGADFQVSVNVEDANGDALDLTDYSLYGQVRRTYKSETAVDFNISTSGNPVNGTIYLELTAQQTSSMKSGRYVYDIYAVNESNNTTVKILEGVLELIPSVTKDIGS